MSPLIYYYLSGIWISPHFMIWCVVKVCGVGSVVAPCRTVGAETMMAIWACLSRVHVSGWVLHKSCLQCFLRPRHATFNRTKTHMAYYSMQGILISPLFYLPFSALFAAILPPLVFFCLCSPFWLPVILLLILKWTTWESFFVSVLSLWDVSLKRSKLPFLSVLLFSSHLVTHQALKHSHLFVCLCKSFSPLWFLMLMWFSFLFK